MAPAVLRSAISNPGAFPRYRESLRYPWSENCEGLPPRHTFFDVKFYPYCVSSTSSGPVFALVGNREVVICRPAFVQGESLSCINVFRDLEPVPADWSMPSSPILNSCAWNYIEQSTPLLSVAGPSGLIKVLNAITGAIVTTLVGHGAEVNDLATHPRYPWILASASGDHSIRIWDLRQSVRGTGTACLIICGHGQGHKEPILSCAWHGRGRYLISGGQDHMVCIWTIPDLAPHGSFFDEDQGEPSSSKSTRETKVIHHPHFATSAVHSNYVDCVCFYGDLVLSKAAEEGKIVLWMATGFNSRAPPPSADSAPATDMPQDTRSGFVQQTGWNGAPSKEAPSQSPYLPEIPLFNRLLQFRLTSTQLFYMRFALLLPSPDHPHLHPMLAIGNTRSKIFFWDLGALATGHNGATATSNCGKGSKGLVTDKTPRAGSSSHQRARPNSRLKSLPESLRASSSCSSPSAIMPTKDSSPPIRHPPEGENSTSVSSSYLLEIPVEAPARSDQYRISNPFSLIQAHHSHTPNVNYYLLARQVAWSPCGRWCVIAGESGSKDGMAVVYDRWI